LGAEIQMQESRYKSEESPQREKESARAGARRQVSVSERSRCIAVLSLQWARSVG